MTKFLRSKLTNQDVALDVFNLLRTKNIPNLVFVLQGTIQGFATVLQRHVENSAIRHVVLVEGI